MFSEFYISNLRKDKRCTECKICSKIKMQKRYKSNKEYFRKYVIKSRKRNQLKVYEYLLQNPCISCGEKDPIVLEFDHLGAKKRDVSALVNSPSSLKAVFSEISKCQVLCANCHRRKTAKEFKHCRYIHQTAN